MENVLIKLNEFLADEQDQLSTYAIDVADAENEQDHAQAKITYYAHKQRVLAIQDVIELVEHELQKDGEGK